MPSASVFSWIDGRGWIILAPGAAGDSDIRAQAIQRISADGALACALVNGETIAGDQVLDDLEDLGAPSGYIVDLVAEDDEMIEARLRDASFILIESGKNIDSVRSTLLGAGERGIRQAYEQGAVILAEGLSAVFLGRWLMHESGNLVAGLDWLDSALIVPTANDLTRLVKPVLDEYPDSFALGIGAATALVLGPDGQVETWGSRHISVTLGSQYGKQG
jgi:hypothetical protein